MMRDCDWVRRRVGGEAVVIGWGVEIGVWGFSSARERNVRPRACACTSVLIWLGPVCVHLYMCVCMFARACACGCVHVSPGAPFKHARTADRQMLAQSGTDERPCVDI